MPETMKTTVNRGENGQYKITVPKAIGDAMELEGQKMEWRIASGNKLEIKKVEE